MKLYISEPSERHSGPILVCDEAHNDVAEFFHNEHATVEQSYETALGLAKQLVDPVPVPELAPWRTELNEVIGHLGACCIQFVDSDDRIIREHVHAAHEILKVLRRKA
jgi:hypothetical protein